MTKRFSGARLFFVNLLYVGLGLAIFLAIDPFSWFEKNEPREIAQAFLEDLEEGNWEDAKEYGTETTRSALDMLESLNSPGTYRVVRIYSVKDNGETAEVRYSLGDYGVNENTLNLRKVDGEWKVEMDKEEINNRDGSDESPVEELEPIELEDLEESEY